MPGCRSNAEDDDDEEEDDEKRERETIIDRDVILVSCDERRVGSFKAREFESFRVARRHPVNASQK